MGPAGVEAAGSFLSASYSLMPVHGRYGVQLAYHGYVVPSLSAFYLLGTGINRSAWNFIHAYEWQPHLSAPFFGPYLEKERSMNML